MQTLDQPSSSLLEIVSSIPAIPNVDVSVTLIPSQVERGQGDSARTLYWPANLTDAGNARLMVQHHGKDLHYCESLGRWFLWDDRRWQQCEQGSIMERAKKTVRAMHTAFWNFPDLDQRPAIIKHILNSESESKLCSMISLAKSEPGIPISVGQLDSHAFLLNCLNGTIDLSTGKLRPHRREDLITRLAPVNFDPAAKCPTFDAFVKRIMAEHDGLIRYLQRAIGYALTASVVEKAIFFLFGSGENGKTTFLEALRKMLGDYAGQLPIESLMMKKSDGGIPNDIAMLRGLRFVTSSEPEQGQKLAGSKIKYLTGNTTVQARFLHQEFFEFPPTHKIFMDANHKPVVRGDDDAIWRRIRNIPFTVTVPKSERDLALPDKLANELPGILAVC